MLIDRGELEDAHRLLERSGMVTRTADRDATFDDVVHARALLRAARGDLDAAREDLARLARRRARWNTYPTLVPAVLSKGLGPESRLTAVTVANGRGFWIDGRPHFLVFRDPSGEYRQDTLRLAGNTLVWEHAPDLLLRLEGAPTLDQALRIANSVGP